MVAVPEVQFAQNDGVRLAWTEHGEGPDIVVLPGLFSNVELIWEHEMVRRVLEWVGRYARVIQYDKRGMGLSDRFVDPPSLEECVDDALTVFDAAGIDRACVIGISEGGLIAQHLAATHPDRVERLALANSAPGATIGGRPEWAEFNADRASYFAEEVYPNWGRDAAPIVERFAHCRVGEEAFIRWMARFQRQCATAADLGAHAANTVRHDAYDLLPSIEAHTLVINCVDDRVVPAATGDALVERLPNAERHLIPGGDHFYWFHQDWLAMSQPMIEFLIGHEARSPAERRFATVVLTDIVGSTAATSERGDAVWADVLDRHDELAWRLTDESEGTIVKSTGDGILARFDVPSHALRFASSFRDALAAEGVTIRVGLHSGQIEIRENNDITGIAVNLAARVEQAATDGSVYVSSTVRDMMLGGSVEFHDRGEHDLKGIDGRWRLYEVAS